MAAVCGFGSVFLRGCLFPLDQFRVRAGASIRDFELVEAAIPACLGEESQGRHDIHRVRKSAFGPLISAIGRRVISIPRRFP